MNITKDDVRMALERIEEHSYGDPYGSDRAVERHAFEALKDEVEDLRMLVRYLAHQALNR